MTDGPTIRRGKSEQSVRTPPEFLAAVELSFGKIVFDLAADAENAVASDYFTEGDDSLSRTWCVDPGLHWLNPPYSNIAPWAQKCAQSWYPARPIAMLVPASIGANWYWDYCIDNSVTFILHPRLKFVGHEHPYPKDLMLCYYGMSLSNGPRIRRWLWETETAW